MTISSSSCNVKLFLPSPPTSSTLVHGFKVASFLINLNVPVDIVEVKLDVDGNTPDWYDRISDNRGLPSIRLNTNTKAVNVSGWGEERLREYVKGGEEEKSEKMGDEDVGDSSSSSSSSSTSSSSSSSSTSDITNVTIKYCPGCGWLHRSQWYVTELMLTFHERRVSKGLKPLLTCAKVIASDVGGTFIIEVDKVVVWDRGVEGGFPDVKVVKQRIRDVVGEGVDLGHSDVGGVKKKREEEGEEEEEEEEEDERNRNMRRMWGVD